MKLLLKGLVWNACLHAWVLSDYDIIIGMKVWKNKRKNKFDLTVTKTCVKKKLVLLCNI